MPLLTFDFAGPYAPDQAATWQFSDATWKDANGNPVDMTGYTAKMQIRADHSPTSAPYDVLTTADGTIALGANGVLTINVPAARTVRYSWGVGYYDFKVTSPAGVVTTLLAGRVMPNPAATYPS